MTHRWRHHSAWRFLLLCSHGICRYGVAPRRVLPLHRQRRCIITYQGRKMKKKEAAHFPGQPKSNELLRSTVRSRSLRCQSHTVRATAGLSEQGLESGMAQNQEQGVGVRGELPGQAPRALGFVAQCRMEKLATLLYRARREGRSTAMMSAR
ncbi:hypothetical protein F5Y08DRAFT_182335 [Xylaria arbuscula]|nr:hypothetical protein F5Y08DRAFT_182335 [Xylaria arbuscula]